MDVFNNYPIDVRAYKKYQLRWMLDHNYCLFDLISSLGNYQMDCMIDSSSTIHIGDCVDDWEQDVGFGGEMWSSFFEFKNNEYLDSDYMKDILTPKEFIEYMANKQ